MRYEVVELGSGWCPVTGRTGIVSGGGKHEGLRSACAEIDAQRLAHGGRWTVIDLDSDDEVEEFDVEVEYDEVWNCLIDDLGMNLWEATHLVEEAAGFPSGRY